MRKNWERSYEKNIVRSESNIFKKFIHIIVFWLFQKQHIFRKSEFNFSQDKNLNKTYNC